MIIIDRKIHSFKVKDIWWADAPYDVNDCDSVTFHGCKSKTDIEGFTYNMFTTLIIDLTQRIDIIWNNMKKDSCRRQINRAKKDGIEIKINQNYDEFYDIDKLFRKNKNLSPGYIDIDFMKKYGTLFTAEIDGEVLGGRLYLEDNNNIRGLIGSSKRLDVNNEKAVLISCANRLMVWNAINYAKEKGIKEFDFGGYYTGINDEEKIRINTFKKSFGGNTVVHHLYIKDYSKMFKFIRYLYPKIYKT